MLLLLLLYHHLLSCLIFSPVDIAFVQEIAAKKAALLEGKARREERIKAVASRSASVVRLMELESDSIRNEKEAVVSQHALLPFVSM